MDEETLEELKAALNKNDLKRMRRVIESAGVKHVCDHFAQCVDHMDQFVFIDRPESSEITQSRVFIGPLSKMQQIELIDATRFRDGGTTLYKLANGTKIEFLAPSKSGRSKMNNCYLFDLTSSRLPMMKREYLDN